MTDLKRKIYRIIYNMSRFGKNPTMDDLKIKTGKDEQSIRNAVRNLMSRNELAWDKGEERNGGLNKKTPLSHRCEEVMFTILSLYFLERHFCSLLRLSASSRFH